MNNETTSSTITDYLQNRTTDMSTQIDRIHKKYAQICGVTKAMLRGFNSEHDDAGLIYDWLDWSFKVPEHNFKDDNDIQHYKYFRKMHDIYKQLNISDQTFCEWMVEHDYNQILKTRI